ncbi:ABC transporter substrate-binding protein [Spirochaetia bacterium]|nr:ABC transporter substrate-binding protein [Spirochaetia bacterium]
MKKGWKLVFTAALAAALLAGCSGARKQGGGGVQQNMDNLNPTGLPIVKEKESFTVFADDGFSPEKTMFEIFEKETNVHLNLMLYPNHVAGERKNILLASGDYPDVIGGWITGDVVKMAADGVIIPLEDIIDQYTVHIKEILDMPGVRERMTLPDGHIYSPPYLIEEPQVTFKPWINVKWLKQLGLEMPSTTDEFKNVLIAFRDRIPPVNGRKVIPLSWNPYQLNLGVLAGWFGINAQSTFAIIDGQVEITINRNEFREFLKYFADLYASGLVDSQLFTQDYPSWVAKGKQGLYGAAFSYWPDDFAPRTSDDVTVNRWDFEPLPVLRAPGVLKPVFVRNTNGMTLFKNQFVITDRASNPITIMRWLDYVYEMENSIQAQYGPIGLRVEKLPDGTYREKDTSSWSDAQKEKYSDNNNFVWSLPKYKRKGFKLLPPEGQSPEFDIEYLADPIYEPYLEAEMLDTPWMDSKTSQQVAELTQPITYYYRQKLAQWISGQAGIDAEWDKYVAELDRLGIQKLLQIQRDLRKK